MHEPTEDDLKAAREWWATPLPAPLEATIEAIARFRAEGRREAEEIGFEKGKEAAYSETFDRLETHTLHRLVCNADHSKPIGGDFCICDPLKGPFWEACAERNAAEARLREVERERDEANRTCNNLDDEVQARQKAQQAAEAQVRELEHDVAEWYRAALEHLYPGHPKVCEPCQKIERLLARHPEPKAPEPTR